MNATIALAAALRSVVAIRNGSGTVIGTGTVVARNTVLTALHVVQDEQQASLSVAQQPTTGAVATLPTWRYGKHRRVARISNRRSSALTGFDGDAVDLAMLTVSDLQAPATPLRRHPVRPGELVTVGGYPNGRWAVTVGPVTSADDADYVAHLLLGPGCSGAPALDGAGRICGMITMDHFTAGAILIGPQLLTAFTRRAGSGASRAAQPCRWCAARDPVDYPPPRASARLTCGTSGRARLTATRPALFAQLTNPYSRHDDALLRCATAAPDPAAYP